jgi:glycine cleavage system H protein
MTDISQTIAGRILHVRVRRPGTLRLAGKPVATIESSKWAGPVPNPFECTIAAANPEVLDNPALLNQHPYRAWIVRVRPAAPLEQALAGLLSGEPARAGFCDRVRNEDIHCKRIAS